MPNHSQSETILDGVDLSGAILDGADLRGVDLSQAKGLTQEQVDTAVTDEYTRLPSGVAEPESQHMYRVSPQTV